MDAIEPQTGMQAGHPHHVRTDRLHSDLVDQGIALQDRVGTVCALEYLQSRSIAAEIIRRVLLDPRQRRKRG